MGTSLNGLTPAATYSGLLKFGDNSPLDSNLRVISDGNGQDTQLYLSDTKVSFGGWTKWDSADNVFYAQKLAVGNNEFPFPGQLSFGDPDDGLIVTASNITNNYSFSDYNGTILELGVGPNTHTRLKSSNFHIGSNSDQFSRNIYFDNGFSISSNAAFNIFEIVHNASLILQYAPDLGFTYFNMPLSWDGYYTFKALDSAFIGGNDVSTDYLRVELNGIVYRLQLFAD